MNLIAREGYTMVGVSGLIGLLFVVLGVQLGSYIGMFLVASGVVLFGFVSWFFRDPDRHPPDVGDSELLIVAPADGKILLIKDVEEDLYIKGPATQLSIFLSVFNVHVNRIPVTGEVEYCHYIPGDYLVAWHPKSSELNERSEIGVRHISGRRVLFKQIAGAVARRIVYYVKEGDAVSLGDRFGIVKFGSRMDVIVPRDVIFDVAVGDSVVGGETVLARI